jgi:E3 ubiquitin-protein ligase FANCL
MANEAEKALAYFQDAWDVLDDMDSHCLILEPETINPTIMSRRIALARPKNSSVALDINPANPRTRPEMRFFGPESVVRPLKQAAIMSSINWNSSMTVRENLEQILDIEFMLPRSEDPRKTQAEDTLMTDCGICYSSRSVTGSLIDCNCDNTLCARPFHRACLVEWLTSVPSSHHSFNTVFGECPYCSAQISASLS